MNDTAMLTELMGQFETKKRGELMFTPRLST